MAIAHQQTQGNDDVNAGGLTTITITAFAVGAGSDRTLVAYVLWGDATTSAEPSVSSVILDPGGTPEGFTYRAETHWNPFGDNYYNSEIWTLDNPSNVTKDITATIDEATANNIALAVSEYTGANNGIGANTGHYSGIDGSPTCTFTTGAADSLICAGLVSQIADAAPYTEGAGTTQRYEPGIGFFWAGEEAASGGADTIDVTENTARRTSMVAIEIQAAGGAAGRTTLNTDTYGLGIKPGMSRTFKIKQ